MDQFDKRFQGKHSRELFTGFICLVSFLLGLSMVTQGGMYVFLIFDYYSASGMVLLSFCFFEIIAIAWVYGIDKWYGHVEEMIGSQMPKFAWIGYKIWLKSCWMFITPLATFVSPSALRNVKA